MKEIFNKLIVYAVFCSFYFMISKFIGFEDTVIICFATIIGEHALNQKQR